MTDKVVDISTSRRSAARKGTAGRAAVQKDGDEAVSVTGDSTNAPQPAAPGLAVQPPEAASPVAKPAAGATAASGRAAAKRAASGKATASKAAAGKAATAKSSSAKPSPAKPSPTKSGAGKTAAAPSLAAAPVAASEKPEAPPAASKETETVATAISVHGPVGKEAVRRNTNSTAPAKAEALKNHLKPINLALQGGGAHGAFTWGVLDRLLEDGRIVVEGISGTSAGAMNAAVLASGLARGGNEGGREALAKYWRAVSKDGRTSPLQRTLLDRLMGNWSLNMNPAYITMDVMSRFFSPYDLNPLNINPLMDLIAEHVDFDSVQACSHVHVFVSATNVHTGKVKVFSKHELTPAAIMASACLPNMFQAVEIDGVPYWDGGFMGNPAMFPFYDAVKTDDILLIQINPIIRRETPKTARDIQNRMNEITFNASLLAQLRAAEFVTRLLNEGRLSHKGDGVDGYRNLRMHRIDGAEKLVALDASTKMNAEWEFLLFLRDIGREAAEGFLERHYDDIGVRSTLDVHHELKNG
ncbi:putative acylesterase/phospholipase RssA [Ancylobacter sp. 3268]|uniref:patatin-like phospholipase family protein n=1 Tax=Ancylobacter sp. 3268 TaxID=2817752 RepID=UPI0028605DB8|nr:patatin-like phospholipase family protein [Ancylobacter sp. 3268]MDR6952028.1 putative acylesterase/phospholipase RssA [Ancylobacter sp. 3268]